MGNAAKFGAWILLLACGCASAPESALGDDLDGEALREAVRVDRNLQSRELSAGFGPLEYELWCDCVRGKGLPKDERLARHFLTRAAELDYGPAVRELAWLGVRGEAPGGGGLAALDALAEKGDLNARYYAVCVRAERGELDDAERWKRIERLAADGSDHARHALAKEWRTRPAGRWWLHELAWWHDADCAFEIGRAFETGDGLPKSLPEASDWYLRAYGNGRSDAGEAFARTYAERPDPNGFLEWGASNNRAPLELAEAGIPGAIYLEGRELVDSDLWEGCREDGIRLIRFAALTGKCPPAAVDLAERFGAQPGANAESRVRYAECREFGWGVEASVKDAARWYAEAAGSGSREADYLFARLTLLHAKELGVDPADAEKKAMDYFSAAAVAWAPAQCAMGLAHSEGWRTDLLHHERNPEACASWLRHAADQGYARAQLELGRCSERGYGVEKSRERARDWYAKAAKQRRLLERPVPDRLLDEPVRAEALLAFGRIGFEDARRKGAIKEALSAIRLAYSLSPSAEAADLLARAYETGRGAPKSPEVAAAWRRQARALLNPASASTPR